MNIAYTFSDVLIEPCYSDIISRKDVDISTTLTNKFGKKFKFNLPVVSANMKDITGSKMAKEMQNKGGLGILHRFNSPDDAVRDLQAAAGNPYSAGVSVGVQMEDQDRFLKLYDSGARIFCIDVAHGHHILVKHMLSWIDEVCGRKREDMLVIAGNIATDWAAIELIKWGADVIKVGIGPGSVCQTRNNTGCGVPQLYALEKIRKVCPNASIIADGGITSVGDIAKALKYADMVMLGGFIAGTSETPGNAYKGPDGQYYKVYGGSASGENKGKNNFVEGMTKTVPFKGKVKYILREIEDGLQSAFSYTGSNNMIEFKENCKFNFISGGSSKESKF